MTLESKIIDFSYFIFKYETKRIYILIKISYVNLFEHFD